MAVITIWFADPISRHLERHRRVHPQRRLDPAADSAIPGGFAIDSRAYIRLRPDSDASAVEQQMRPFVDTLLPRMMKGAYPAHEGDRYPEGDGGR